MQQTGEPWRLGHRPALDGLRGVAILLVVVFHVVGVWFPGGGMVGVGLFFTLSGFLITTLLLEERGQSGRVDLLRFYARRARRLLPALLAVLVVAGAAQVAVGMSSPTRLLPVLLYSANWFAAGGAHLRLFGHAWSLSVEEQFYFVWPLILLAAIRWRGLLAVTVLGIGGSLVARFLIWDGGAGHDGVYFGTLPNAAALLAGCLLAILARRGLPAARSRGWVWVGLAGLLGLCTSGSVLWVPALVPVVAAVLVWGACAGGGNVLTTPVLRYLGRRSYGWYLWHYPIVVFVGTLAESPVSRTVAALSALGVAELSWRFVERPFLRPFSGERLDRAAVPPALGGHRLDAGAVPPAFQRG